MNCDGFKIYNLTENDDDSMSPFRCSMQRNLKENILFLSSKSEQKAVEYLRERYLKEKYHTWCGDILLIINPYKNCLQQSEAATELECNPSIEAITRKAWSRLGTKRNQTIVISGDSGSGKTYTASSAIKSLVYKQKDARKNILIKILSAGPLLTAFGNAATSHNENSSRFGQLLQLQCKNGKIIGAYIKSFLLEKSRVSDVGFNESNFHIFNQILERNEESKLTEYRLTKQVDYKIAPKFSIFNRACEEMAKSLISLEITNHKGILGILSAILNLGNISFEEDCNKNAITIIANDFAANAASVLKTDVNKLAKLFTIQTIYSKTGGKRRESTYVFLCSQKAECDSRRKCLMRYLYEKLFKWLVCKINNQIFVDEEHISIGILDIYGFETFPHNTFEQLCINYANERLHYHFLQDYIVKRQELLYNDGVQVSFFDLDEYSQRLVMFSGVPSVFSILNEESLLKRYNADVFVNSRLNDELKYYKHFETSNTNFGTTFCIQHFAGRVKYDVRGMVAKNKDKIPNEMISFLRECKLEFLEEMLFVNAGDVTKEGTLLWKFKKSLDDLIKVVKDGDVHYVKCLRPNQGQIPQMLDEGLFIQQMRSNGILDVLSCEQKYPISITYEDFSAQFGVPDLLEVLMEDVHLGKTHMYMTEVVYEKLFRCDRLRKSVAAKKIQRIWREFAEKRKNAEQTQMWRETNVEESIPGNTAFDRDYFWGDRVVTRFRIPKIPIRFHLSKTCIPYSFFLPISEIPKGLPDLLQTN